MDCDFSGICPVDFIPGKGNALRFSVRVCSAENLFCAQGFGGSWAASNDVAKVSLG